MTNRHFEKCLVADIRHGVEPNQSRTYILPYTGYLTDAKYESLAQRMVKQVGDTLFKPGYEPKMAESYLFDRLRSAWFATREKNVTVEKDELGTYTLKSEGCWFCFGYKAEDFVIVERA
jgi:hypothetical protein